MLAKLDPEGDVLYAVERAGGEFRLTSRAPPFGERMKIVEDLMRRYARTLGALA